MAVVIADLKKSTEQRMDKTVQSFKTDLGKVRTGRAHTGLLDHVRVDYNGTPTPLNQVAKVILLDATAFALCRDQRLPIRVFSIFKSGALKRVVQGEDEGTLVHV